MDQVDRGIGFQQVAPGPLAGMRLARDQQHPQSVADPVDRQDRRVVAVGQLAILAGNGDLHHVQAAAVQLQRQDLRRVGRDLVADRLGAVDRDQEVHPLGQILRRVAQGLDAQVQLDRLADDGEGGGGVDHQPPVPFVAAPGQNDMHRCGEAVHHLGVVHLPVGQQDRAGDPVGRHFGRGFGQHAHQPGAVLGVRAGAVGDADLAHLERRGARRGPQPVQRLPDLGLQPFHLAGPHVDLLAGRGVGDDEGDVRQVGAILLAPAGIGQRGQQHQRAQPPQPPARQAAPKRQRDQPEADRGQRPEQPQRHQRCEGDRAFHALSSPAGRAAPARGPGRTCSCRSSRTSPG